MRRITALLLAFLLVFLGASTVHAAPLDEIQTITINANTSVDGIVTLRYEVEWKVLDSTSEGPLSWVHIGVPNDANEIIDYGGDAISASPYNEDGESGVRIDLNREFNEGETTKFYFTVRQYNLLYLNGNEYCCDFVPGWFDGIDVKQLTVHWQPDNITHANAELDNGEYSWSSSMDAGQHFQTVTTYYSGDMILASAPAKSDYDSDYPSNTANTYVNTSNSSSHGGGFGSFIGTIFFILVFVLSLISSASRGYRRGRGFTGTPPGFFHGGGFHGGGGCACACAGCACACACAGGGRAGCARKDFTNFPTKQKEIEPNENA